jgi:plastocyanin
MTIEAIARRFALPLIILALLPSSSTGQATSKPKPVTHTLTIEGMQFGPATLAVKTGDSIVWVNKDMFPHTVTARDGAFDSRQIEPGKSWTYRAVKKGTFAYVCSLHPTMQAQLRVR